MITEKCIWYNNTEKDISKLLPIFTIKKNNFDTTFFNNIEHSKSNYHKQNNFYVNKNYIDLNIDINKLINKKDESLLRNSIKKESTIKSIINKNDRQIKNYNNIITPFCISNADFYIVLNHIKIKSFLHLFSFQTPII